MTWFGIRKSRNVAEIVSGLTTIVSELDASIITNEKGKKVCECDHAAETSRHNLTDAEINDREYHLDRELKQAATVRGNLSKLLDVS